MADAAFHLTEEFITEDLEYYFSGERDKNNQIRPDDNIYSMTPTSTHLSVSLEDDKVGNFFYPTLPNLFDRVYIGISIPLFASNWGASFLLELLKVVKPGGVIILPVYPEGQAQEKGHWSRSFLENIFLSRERWTGFSNVRAENDGVMSLSVGRKWPDPIASTAQWFYQQRANLALGKLLEAGNRDGLAEAFAEIATRVWANYTHNSVIERIILDTFGVKAPVKVNCVSNDYGLLVTDLLLSSYINVEGGSTVHITQTEEAVAKSFASYFAPHTGDQHDVKMGDRDSIEFNNNSDVICLIHALSGLNQSQQEALIDKAWGNLNTNGLLIVHDVMPSAWHKSSEAGLHQKLENLGALSTYSSIVASKIENNVEISHYSSIQEAKLVEEREQQATVFKVIQKM
ncbi:MAG: hypothetical protein GKR92_07570 [Gammaproteobacteria bacterium]|nr:MAG: hypothetical protein GKR92_07570 [Gammaproteobacteria bacterium]